MRSPTLSRLYLQCAPDEDIEQWPDARIWDELHTRLGGVRTLQEGKILQKGITPMRSFVAEPMQYGRLFLAGDAAHIVPPTGAKGMNLAIADVRVLSRAIEDFLQRQQTTCSKPTPTTCLRRVWKAQRFSWWMTQMLHRFPDETPFDTAASSRSSTTSPVRGRVDVAGRELRRPAVRLAAGRIRAVVAGAAGGFAPIENCRLPCGREPVP